MMRSVCQVLILFILTFLTATAQQQPTEDPSQPSSASQPASDTPSQPGSTNQPASDIPSQPSKDSPTQVSVIADRVFAQEARLVESMHHFTPLVETYIQNLRPDPDFVTVPGSDRYFLGRFLLGQKGVSGRAFKDNNRSSFMYQVLDRLD